MSDGYRRQRVYYGDNGGSLSVTPFTPTTTLVTHRSKHSLFVQTVRIQVTSGVVGVTWSVQDSAGVSITGPVSASTAPFNVVLDFGPDGIALTALADLSFVPSAPGAAGILSWDAYQRLVEASIL